MNILSQHNDGTAMESTLTSNIHQVYMIVTFYFFVHQVTTYPGTTMSSQLHTQKMNHRFSFLE